MLLRQQANRIKLPFLIGFSVIAIYFLGLFTRMYADNRLELEDGNVFLDSIKMSLRASRVATMGHGSKTVEKTSSLLRMATLALS